MRLYNKTHYSTRELDQLIRATLEDQIPGHIISTLTVLVWPWRPGFPAGVTSLAQRHITLYVDKYAIDPVRLAHTVSREAAKFLCGPHVPTRFRPSWRQEFSWAQQYQVGSRPRIRNFTQYASGPLCALVRKVLCQCQGKELASMTGVVIQPAERVDLSRCEALPGSRVLAKVALQGSDELRLVVPQGGFEPCELGYALAHQVGHATYGIESAIPAVPAFYRSLPYWRAVLGAHRHLVVA